MYESSADAEEFAVSIVKRLRSAGFYALWAGGCVRDRLLGRPPKDFDVATNATPQQVRAVFGSRKTLAIGEAFGVVAVFHGRNQPPVEVATFRKDATYSDGRHPDSVSFSSAEEDAKRRDFTINGMFYDPIDRRVIDYVGGQRDLKDGVIRCIGDSQQRFSEDRLRMLRAVRFATIFKFQLEGETLRAIQSNARHIHVVSAERIASELRRMFSHENVAIATELLSESGLRQELLPELSDNQWTQGARIIAACSPPTFESSCAALLLANTAIDLVNRVSARWKLSNTERAKIASLVQHESSIRVAHSEPWPKIQRILIEQDADDLVSFAEAVATYRKESLFGIEFCRKKLALPSNRLNPLPLLTGDDLTAAGISPGPIFKTILNEIRDQQLNEQIETKAEAMKLAVSIAQKS
ncbi:MAG: CCA tRNA nucleotidyltransferase [Planctomycetales bacterium]|nr:CCA tRNA nucleotidyltransferase [Planctomycetales bacterium]